MQKANPKNWDGAKWAEVAIDVVGGIIAWRVTFDPIKGIIFSSALIVLSTVRDIIIDNIRLWRNKG